MVNKEKQIARRQQKIAERVAKWKRSKIDEVIGKNIKFERSEDNLSEKVILFGTTIGTFKVLDDKITFEEGESNVFEASGNLQN